MIRKPPNMHESSKLYLKSAAYCTSIIVASSKISYVVGDILGEYIRKLGWFNLYTKFYQELTMRSPNRTGSNILQARGKTKKVTLNFDKKKYSDP